MPQYIKAPFNFVPLNKEVYYPDWADKVSHDVPFSDGESGVIELKIKAETPIFVRNGHLENVDKESDDYLSFSHYKYLDENGNNKKQYFIPGTTIKGMIRSVLEVMSFSELDQYEKDSFSFREMNDEYLKKMKSIQCGWLRKEGENYYLKKLGEPKRISIEDIDKEYETTIYDFIRTGDFKNDENRTAKQKYDLFKEKSLINYFKKVETSGRENRKFVEFSSEGEQGTIVFTGQPGARNTKQKTGKLYDFVFMNDPDAEFELISNSKLIQQFKSVHKNSLDFEGFGKRKEELENGIAIPVFFMEKRSELHSIGLSYLYKLPYENSIEDIVNKQQKKNIDQNKLDLVNTIFGFTDKKRSLKGRIQCGHALMKSKEEPELGVRVVTLGSPKASYNPIYIEQQGINNSWKTNEYKTYDDNDSVIAGRKRYPVRNLYPDLKSEDDYDANLDSKLIPLNSGVEFTAKVKVHNLRKIELGALLSALTFHNSKNQLFHNLGLAKSLGLGKVSITISSEGFKYTNEEYMSEFELEMDKFISNWLNQPQLTQLFAMAYDTEKGIDKLFLRYMHMDTNSKKNEFILAKDAMEFLKRYSEISKAIPEIKSLKHIVIEQNEKNKQEKLNQLNNVLHGHFTSIDSCIESNKIPEAKANLEKAILFQEENIEKISEPNILSEYKQKVQIADKLENARKLFENSEWKKAKEKFLVLKDMDLKDVIKAEVLDKFEKCKNQIAQEISFETSIDTELTFDENNGKVKYYLKNKGGLKVLPDEDIPVLKDALKKLRKKGNKGDKKEWIQFDFTRSIWKKYVVKWVGQEKALELFNEIIG